MQDAFGYVPEPAIPMIAEALDLSRARFTAFSPFIMTSGTSPPASMCLNYAVRKHVRPLAAMRWRRKPKETWCFAREHDCRWARYPGADLLPWIVRNGAAMLDGKLVGRLDAKRLDALVSEAQR
jgi:formate dehydrogenase subunit gamma